MKINLPSLKLNYIYSTLNTVLTMLFPLITFPYVTRILQPTGIGINSFAHSIVQYFVLFAQLGIPIYGIRAIAQVKGDKEKLSKTISELLIINCITTLFSLIFLVLSTLLFSQIYEIKKLIFVYSFMLVLVPFGIEYFYGGIEKYKYITIRSLIVKIISLFLLFSFVRTKNDIIPYAIVITIGTTGNYICNFYNLHKYTNLQIKNLKIKNLVKHINSIIIFFLMNIFSTIYVLFPTTILGFVSTKSSVGLFATASKICLTLFAFTTTLGKVMLPRLSYYIANKDITTFNRLIIKSFNFTFFIASFVVVFLCFKSESLIVLLCGKNFIQASITLKLMSFVILFAGISGITGLQILVPLKKEKIVTFSLGIGALFSLVLYFLFIPIYNYNGAAITMSITELSILFIQYFYLKKIYPISVNWFLFIRNIVVSVLSVCPTLYLQYLNFNVFGELVLSGIISFILYITILLMLKDNFVIYLKEILNNNLNKKFFLGRS